MVVWVCLAELLMEYFSEDIIKLILENIGALLNLDKWITIVECGRYTRATVEIDLEKPLVATVRVRYRLQHGLFRVRRKLHLLVNNRKR